jgi:hypothetical protein
LDLAEICFRLSDALCLGHLIYSIVLAVTEF